MERDKHRHAMRSIAARRGWITRRARQQREREAEARANAKTFVRPCVRCGSRQLCDPDCSIAPWNLDKDGAA